MEKKTQKEFFERAVSILTEIETLQEDLKELKLDFKYTEDNPEGIPKEEIAEATKVARVYVKDQFSKKKREWSELEEAWESLVG
jgi:hypothetical protein